MIRGKFNLIGYKENVDPRAALATAGEALALARRLGRRSDVSALIMAFADAAFGTGDWPLALAELEAALADDFEGTDRMAVVGQSTVIRALRGEPIDDLMNEVGRLGASLDPTVRPHVIGVPAALGAFASGRLAEAREGWHRLADLFPMEAAYHCVFAARAATWLADASGAREDLTTIDEAGARGPVMEANRTTIRAGIAALEGDPDTALGLYREALRAWRDLGLVWDEALCAIDMATVLDPAHPEVRATAEAGREILVRLGARPFVERLDAALASGLPAASA